MPATIAVLGTLDTKGEEHAFVAEQIRSHGLQALLIDVGTGSPATVAVDIPRETVAAAGNVDLAEVVAQGDRGAAVAAMSRAAPELLRQLHEAGRIQGVVSLGGGGGTAIATAAMRALPLGVPKLMVSTLASGNTAPYVGASDIVMMPAVVDIAGLNRISRSVLSQAAGAICGMVASRDRHLATKPNDERQIIAASMFGNTTGCVQQAKAICESAGYEVLVFHATGMGGRTLESLVAAGWIAGVLDVTTTEWADELVGGVLSAGPHRLEAAARAGVPAVVAPGCLDMVNFGPPETVPPQFREGRTFYAHNPQVTLMRTTPAECAELGRIIAEKLNTSTGPVSVCLPLRGISVISAPGGMFHDPVADQALFDSLKRHLRRDIPVIEIDVQINDAEFARECAERLLEMVG